MKPKVLFTTILLSLSTFVFGQHFGSVGTQWFYNVSGGSGSPADAEYWHLQSVADTVIKGVTTHKISRTYYRYVGDSVTSAPLFVVERSDTVFMYNFQKAAFQPIYIFNASKGDTLILPVAEKYPWTKDSTYRLVIDQVETLLFDGIPLKKFRTKSLDKFYFENDGYYIERIGGTGWFFPRDTFIPEDSRRIRCYKDNQIDTNFQQVPCDHRLVASLKDLHNQAKINVFPNPAGKILSVQTEQQVEKMVLTDLTGKKLIEARQSNLDFSNIHEGIYLLTIHLKMGQRITRKIIKKTL